MYQFVVAQQTSTQKFTAIFFRFRTKEHVLRVNKSKVTAENAFNEDIYQMEDNRESMKH